MKKINTVSIAILSLAFILGITGPLVVSAATDPGLGAAATFSIIAQTAITGTGTISGDVGINSTGAGITALTDVMVDGTLYSTDGVVPGLAILDAAVQTNLSSANGNISAQGATASVGPVLDGEILTTGVYDIGAGRLSGGILTLDGPGIYIFRASSDLVSSGSINLINGARACDVYWQVNTLATITGTSFIGTIIAGTGVHFGADVALNGRALALGGDVTLLNNTISGPTCATPLPTLATLHVVKTVINDNGGTAVASDFSLHVKLSGTDVAGSPASGAITPRTTYSLSAGEYMVSEDVSASYTQSFSGDCNASGSVTLSAGDTKTCTITNNDIAAVIVPPTPVLAPTTTTTSTPILIPTTTPIIAPALTPTPTTPSPVVESVVAPAPVSAPIVPKFPNTGFAPEEKSNAPWGVVISTGVLVALLSFYVARKKQTA